MSDTKINYQTEPNPEENPNTEEARQRRREENKRFFKIVKWVIRFTLIAFALVSFYKINLYWTGNHYSYLLLKAESYRNTGDYENAMEIYNEAIELKDKEPLAYEALADVYMETDDADSARNILDTAENKVYYKNVKEIRRKRDSIDSGIYEMTAVVIEDDKSAFTDGVENFVLNNYGTAEDANFILSFIRDPYCIGDLVSKYMEDLMK